MSKIIQEPRNYKNLEELASEFCRRTKQTIERKEIFDVSMMGLPCNIVASGISLLLKDQNDSTNIGVITFTYGHHIGENFDIVEVVYKYTGPLNGRKVQLLTKIDAFYRKNEDSSYKEIVKRVEEVPVWFLVEAGTQNRQP